MGGPIVSPIGGSILQPVTDRVFTSSMTRTITKGLKKGDQGEAVQNLQETIKSLGGRIQVTGTYDRQTEAALRDLQKRHKLKASGKLDTATIYVLNEGSLPKLEPYSIGSMKEALRAVEQLDALQAVQRQQIESLAADLKRACQALSWVDFRRDIADARKKLAELEKWESDFPGLLEKSPQKAERLVKDHKRRGKDCDGLRGQLKKSVSGYQTKLPKEMTQIEKAARSLKDRLNDVTDNGSVAKSALKALDDR